MACHPQGSVRQSSTCNFSILTYLAYAAFNILIRPGKLYMEDTAKIENYKKTLGVVLYASTLEVNTEMHKPR